jgi:hypothetical protein
LLCTKCLEEFTAFKTTSILLFPSFLAPATATADLVSDFSGRGR